MKEHIFHLVPLQVWLLLCSSKDMVVSVNTGSNETLFEINGDHYPLSGSNHFAFAF